MSNIKIQQEDETRAQTATEATQNFMPSIVHHYPGGVVNLAENSALAICSDTNRSSLEKSFAAFMVVLENSYASSNSRPAQNPKIQITCDALLLCCMTTKLI